MNSKIFLAVVIVITTLLLLLNIYSMINSPIQFTLNIVLTLALILAASAYGKSKQKESYNYYQENPNALVSGKNISGTVYASYPENDPGLGWIL